MPSKTISGDGGIGSIRQIGEAVLEIMIGRSRHSYSYAQVRGPMASFAYHRCLALEPESATLCKIVYMLTYDQAAMDAERRSMEAKRIAVRFGGAVEAMKLAAELSE